MTTDERAFLAWYASLPADAAALVSHALLTTRGPLLCRILSYVRDHTKKGGYVPLAYEREDVQLRSA